MSLSDNSILLHNYSTNHFIVKILVSDLLTAPIVKWKNNRPADMQRCADIATSCWNKRQSLDWLFYVSQQADGTFAVLDGWHRYNTIRFIHDSIVNPPQDLTAPTLFTGDASWFYNNYVLISVRINMSYGEEIDLFQNINKSNPVAELYLRTENDEKMDFINNLTTQWMVKYKSHFKTSANPRIPNTNRDRFVDFLSAVYDHVGKDNVEKWLMQQNILYQSSPPTNCSFDAMWECKKTGCYLFLRKFDDPIYAGITS